MDIYKLYYRPWESYQRMRNHGRIDYEVYSNILFVLLFPCAHTRILELFPENERIDTCPQIAWEL